MPWVQSSVPFFLMDSIEAGEVRTLAALFQNTQVLFSGSVTPIPGNLIPCPLNSTNTRHTGAHTNTHAHRKPIKVPYLGAYQRSTGLMTKISGMVLPSSSSETILRLSNILSLDLNKSCNKSKTKHLYRIFLVLLFIFPSSAEPKPSASPPVCQANLSTTPCSIKQYSQQTNINSTLCGNNHLHFSHTLLPLNFTK